MQRPAREVEGRLGLRLRAPLRLALAFVRREIAARSSTAQRDRAAPARSPAPAARPASPKRVRSTSCRRTTSFNARAQRGRRARPTAAARARCCRPSPRNQAVEQPQPLLGEGQRRRLFGLANVRSGRSSSAQLFGSRLAITRSQSTGDASSRGSLVPPCSGQGIRPGRLADANEMRRVRIPSRITGPPSGKSPAGPLAPMLKSAVCHSLSRGRDRPPRSGKRNRNRCRQFAADGISASRRTVHEHVWCQTPMHARAGGNTLRR